MNWQEVLVRVTLILIAGDFNCPDIDWEHGLLLTDTYMPKFLQEKLLSLSQNFQLNQMITFPPRGMNTLDLCYTSHPSINFNCVGFSDHDAILATLSVSYYQPKQQNTIIQKSKSGTDMKKAISLVK